MLAFARRPGESINAPLARYEVVRQRAATEGQLVMSVDGMSLQLSRATGVQPSQLILLSQQFGGTLPTDEAQYHQLVVQ